MTTMIAIDITPKSSIAIANGFPNSTMASPSPNCQMRAVFQGPPRNRKDTVANSVGQGETAGISVPRMLASNEARPQADSPKGMGFLGTNRNANLMATAYETFFEKIVTGYAATTIWAQRRANSRNNPVS